jgi:ABC-type Zn uptake system ZnuABC Zn-binding protein ZnuA
MSPLLACRMTETIRDELKLANPAGAAEYDRRAGEYIAKLKAIHADGVARLKGKENRRLITMHESMNYFAEAFDLKIAGSIQSAPGQEPSRKKLDQVVKVCLDKKITVLAVEPQYTTSNAVQAIQRELKAKGGTELIVIELDPLETCTTPLPAADFYETKLKANLDALVKALK